jgi:hypothetical protein
VQLIVEIELRQHLGLMPTKMADLQVLSRQRRAFEVIATAMRKLGATPDQLQVIGDVHSGRRAIEEMVEALGVRELTAGDEP